MSDKKNLLIVGVGFFICTCVIISIILGLHFYKKNQKDPGASKLQANMEGGNVATSATRPAALEGTSAIELGILGMSPWGPAPHFVSREAKWMWNTSTAATEASNLPVTFRHQYWNGETTPIEAELHVIADDNAVISINGAKIGEASGGWERSNYPMFPVSLQPGNNKIDIVTTNKGGPAALMVALVRKSDKSLLLKSDSSWKI
jgi:hypothetical protein